MKLPDIKRVLREDVPDAPDWITQLTYPLNSLAESVYQALNRQITFEQNIACSIREVEFETSAAYPSTDDQLRVQSGLKSKAKGCLILQLTESATNYVPISTTPFLNWIDLNGELRIDISGLTASKKYFLRLLVF